MQAKCTASKPGKNIIPIHTRGLLFSSVHHYPHMSSDQNPGLVDTYTYMYMDSSWYYTNN